MSGYYLLLGLTTPDEAAVFGTGQLVHPAGSPAKIVPIAEL